MTARFALMQRLISHVPPGYRPLNWWMVLDHGSSLPTNPRLLPAHVRRFARHVRRVHRRQMRQRARGLKGWLTEAQRRMARGGS